jgi:hypothetical protein
LNWWKDTLDQLPNVRDGLLNFSIDFTHADTPVPTGYEPISRISNDFSLWMYDFLNRVGFNQTGNFSTDIRAFNNFQRQQVGADWAFTIFVVNNAVDADKSFAPGGSFNQAFAFAGGRFMVIPASRPVSTYSHETGHMFWAFDEYPGASANYLSRRGYYNTQNLNHALNPTPGFVQANSIMAADDPLSIPPILTLTNAFNAHTSAVSTLETIGWKDSDSDGIFDVLDMPFQLSGTGRYDSATGLYRFTGQASVTALPNQNSSGLQNDIQINQLRRVEVSIDGGAWNTVLTLPARTYQTTLDLFFPVPAGQHTVKMRVADTRTGVMSAEFAGTTLNPTSIGAPGIGGFIFRDDDADGAWDTGEPPLVDFGLEIVDQDDTPIDLMRNVEPSVHPQSTVLNTIHPEAVITAIGGDVQTSQVKALTSGLYPSAGRVFSTQSILQGRPVETWTGASRQLKIEFPGKTSVVSIRAYSGSTGTSFGRLEAYNAQGVLLERFTTTGISGTGFKEMAIRRPSADIAYVVASGHAGTEIVLDTLQWGTKTSATSNVLGAYSLANLPAGTYRVKADPPLNHIVTTPPGGVATITVAPGQSVSGVNFGIRIQAGMWHNLNQPLNVNGDAGGEVTPIDALLVINWFNAHPNQPELPTSGNPATDGFVDVNNDGQCTPIDALLIINRLNMGEGESPGGPEGEGEVPAGLYGGDGVAEGEEGPSTPRTAAEYYAQNPVHFLEIAGADLLGCAHEHAELHQQPSPLPDMATATPPLPVVTTLDADRPTGSTPGRIARTLIHEATARLPVLSQLSPLARKVVAEAASAKTRLDQTLDSIAADVTEAQLAGLAKIALRRPRARG